MPKQLTLLPYRQQKLQLYTIEVYCHKGSEQLSKNLRKSAEC